MIYDRIENLGLYSRMHTALDDIIRFLAETDISALPLDSIDLGNDVTCIVAEYRTAPDDERVIECHRKYIDIHVTLSGHERIGVCARARCDAAGAYVEEKDYQLLTGEVSPIDMPPGAFVMFFPDDAHMPKLPRDTPGEPVCKLVFKLPVQRGDS